MSYFAPRFFGKVEQGVLLLDNIDSYTKYLRTLKGEVEVIVGKWEARRSNKQNDFYRAYLRLIMEETGENDIDRLHEIFKQSFLPKEVYEGFGKKVEAVKSTTKLSKKGFWEYMARIEELTGVPIPDPKKVVAL